MASGKGLHLSRMAQSGGKEKGKLLKQMNHEKTFQAPFLVVRKERRGGS